MAIDLDLSRRAHAVLMQVMDLASPDRRAYVGEVCKEDPALMRLVLELVESADRADGFLEVPSWTPPLTDPSLIPESIGNYLIVGVLGTGGMATVYEAIQEDPQRRVALKVLHQRMTSSQVYARFRFETEALARLHHPAIAQIYEAGAAHLESAATSLFFAMELVRSALPITDYVKRHGRTLAERLELFAMVCEAVQHGHQHGVIHRDIKPANVLVDGEGRPKIIDFGIARATETQADSPTNSTAFGQIVGTLHSMSPEQCNAVHDVDTRTDVYALGVLLYELVTGRRPYDLAGCSIPEAVRIISEVEPPPASRFCREAAGDLDAILTTSMDKDRARRYSSAAALAADVRRYLADLPVEARPASRWIQLQKFVRRNRGLAAASCAAIVLLVVGSVLTARLAFVENRARKAAEQRERQLEMVTEFQESLLRDIDVSDLGQRLRQNFVENVERTPSATADSDSSSKIEGDLLGLVDRVNFTSLALHMLNDSILQRYRESIGTKFSQEPVVQAHLLQQLAGTMNTLGLHAEAEPVLRDALQIRRKELGPDHADTLLTLHSLGSLLSTLGRYDESVDCLELAYERRAELFGADDVATLRTGTSLGGAWRRKGNVQEAERIWSQTLLDQRRVLGDDDPDTLRTLNNMGVVFASQGRFDEAESCWKELVERRRRVLGDDHPDTRSALVNLCSLLQERGKLDEARPFMPLMTQALAADRLQFGDRHSETLTTMGQLASLHLESGELVAAEQLQRECYEGRRASLGGEHPATLLASTGLAKALDAQGKHAEAEALVRVAIEDQRRTLDEGHPDLVDSLALLSRILYERGQVEEAILFSEEALFMGRESLPAAHWMIGQLLSDHGAILLAAGRTEEAVRSLQEAHKMLDETFGKEHPKSREAQRRLQSALIGEARNDDAEFRDS